MKFSLDLQLAIATAFIILTGLLLHQSFSTQSFYQQLAHLSFGLLLFLIITKIDLNLLAPFKTHLYLTVIGLLLITLLVGRATHGSVRWLTLGSWLNFQPSEIAKILLTFSFAATLTHTDLASVKSMLKIGLVYSLPIVLVFIQPDLSSGLIIMVILFSMAFAAGIRFIYQLSFAFLGTASSPLIWKLLKDYQKHRILTFLDPFSDPLGKGYNSIQAIIAVGSGQLLGRGLGHGTQSKLRFLPEHQTDFVFASLAEEIGLVGSLLLIFAYTWLILRLYQLSEQSSTKFGYYVSIGLSTMFAVQTIINIGMNLGILPVTGVTLPLLSAGGSSLVTSLVALGIINKLACSNHSHPGIEIT